MHFTKVEEGMLSLANAKFMSGCTERNLDILARLPLWQIGVDYKCGTGHGVGYILNVHEGPQNIRYRYIEGIGEAILEEGMLVTDEPGVYIEGKYGIRTENVLLVQKDFENSDGQFMKFEMLTFVPIDLELIDGNYLDEKTKDYLNEYHRQVYEKVSPYLEEEERNWLKENTKNVDSFY
jgi:Xaa-Pro aminopeptidase